MICRYCGKEATIKPFCCQQYLERVVKVYSIAEGNYIYNATNGLIGISPEQAKKLLSEGDE